MIKKQEYGDNGKKEMRKKNILRKRKVEGNLIEADGGVKKMPFKEWSEHKRKCRTEGKCYVCLSIEHRVSECPIAEKRRKLTGTNTEGNAATTQPAIYTIMENKIKNATSEKHTTSSPHINFFQLIKI